jgi:Rod binding domain-containing protein
MDASTALLSSTAAPPGAGGAHDPAAIHKAAQDFTSFFLQQSFENMFASVGNDDLFGGGEGEKIYRSLLLQEYSKVAAKGGGLGIEDAVQRQMLHMQEVK